MKKIVLSCLFAGLLAIGCGGDDDDDGGNGPNGTPTVTANTSVASPSLADPDDAVWSSVTATSLQISAGNVPPKVSVDKATSLATSMQVQAIHVNDSLFLRLQWTDDSHNVWRDAWQVVATGAFTSFTKSLNDEDQVFVLFERATEEDWDVWNWRALTTGEGGLAEGMTYDGVLTTDAGGVALVFSNEVQAGGSPGYIHIDSSEYTGYLYPLEIGTTILADTNAFGTIIPQTQGWTVGDLVPFWIIDLNVKNRPSGERNSRWDIRAVSDYDGTMYTLVMAAPTNTGYGDDLNLSSLTQVKVQIGLFDNQMDFSLGSNHRGFTPQFNLVLQ